MKKILSLFVVIILLIASATTAYAADGKVTYSKNAGEFIFEPGSDYSPTDLFPNFKSVMPGDTLTQKITVRNDADNKVKVKIYIRSLGAHEDSQEFLSKLNLGVIISEDNEMSNMFDAAANETAQLEGWVCLGTLYSGGEVNLDVILDVPVELDNNFKNYVGYLDWEFMIEEFPIEEGDPNAPQTSDTTNNVMWLSLAGGSLFMLIILLLLRKKDKEKQEKL